MRTFKITVIFLLLLSLAVLALWYIKGLLPGMGPSEEEFNSIYEEAHEGEEGALDDIYETELKQMEGVVKVLGVSIYQDASHRLERDDQLVVLLRSDAYELDEYLDKEVRVQGMLSDTARGDQKVMTVTNIEALQASKTKVFQDSAFEMSFEYPADVEPQVEGSKITLGTSILVFQYPSEAQTLSVWLKDRDQNLPFEESQVSVAGATAVRRVMTNGDEQVTKTYLQAGKNFYEFRLLSQDAAVKASYLDILDSFRSSAAAVPSQDPTVPEDANSTEVVEEEEEDSPEDSVSDAETDEDTIEVSLLPTEQRTVSGYTTFVGRLVTFDYPKSWYFSYLADEAHYGLTDGENYKANKEEITTQISLVLLFSDSMQRDCGYKKTQQVGNTTYTVCSRQEGLESVVDSIAASIKSSS